MSVPTWLLVLVWNLVYNSISYKQYSTVLFEKKMYYFYF
jgi:hypothetical protein